MEARAPINSTDLYYVREGAGRALVTLHGGLGFDHSYFRPWLDPLAEVAQLLYFDLRGHGRSARVPFAGVDHATFVSDIDSLREFFGHDRITLIGHSYGGFLALEYALKHPDCLDGLVLIATAPAFKHQEAIAANLQARGTPEQVAAFGQATQGTDDEAFKRGFMQVLPLYFERFNPEVAMRMGTGMRYSAAASAHGFRDLLPGYDVTARLGEIKVPTLIATGAHDFIMPREHGGDVLAAGIAGAEHVIFEESGHFPFIEEQEKFLGAMRDFLGRLPA